MGDPIKYQQDSAYWGLEEISTDVSSESHNLNDQLQDQDEIEYVDPFLDQEAYLDVGWDYGEATADSSTDRDSYNKARRTTRKKATPRPHQKKPVKRKSTS